MMETNYFQRLDDPKEVIAIIFVDIVNDIEPDLKKVWNKRQNGEEQNGDLQVFGVDRVPKAAQSKMPKFGGHIARLADLIDQVCKWNRNFKEAIIFFPFHKMEIASSNLISRILMQRKFK